MIRASLILLLCLLPLTADAGNCHVSFRAHHAQVVQAQQVILVPQYAAVAYQVGASYRDQAVVEATARRVVELLAAQQANTSAGTVSALESSSIVAQKCGACHKSKGVAVTLSADASCETRLEAIRRLMLPVDDPQHMPQGGTLTPEEAGDVIEYLTTGSVSR